MKNLSLVPLFNNAHREEDLKFYFAQHFHIPPDSRNNIDLYTPQILFEFKLNANLQNTEIRAKCFAQALYYVRRLEYGEDNRATSSSICIVTKNFAAILPTEIFSEFYSNKKAFDWRRQPSSPCEKLVAALASFQNLRDCHVYNFSNAASQNSFVLKITDALKTRQTSLFKKIINENNFFAVYQDWLDKFGASVRDERKPSEYFVTDIEAGKSELVGTRRIVFRLNDGSTVEKDNFPQYAHTSFWENHEKVSDQRRIIAIRQKMDCLTEDTHRRRTGEFYTPEKFADAAVGYLDDTINLDDPNLRLWDMAAGTGNLIYSLIGSFDLRKCYISTLNPDDAAYCQKIFPAATAFQYDYLNDDVEFIANPQLWKLGAKFKMPKNLAADLQNPKIKWIIFINPPYATANNYERDKSQIDKEEVSFTAVQKLMTDAGMGEVSRELFSQFLYRISLEFKNRTAWLGIFSKIKYLNANNDQTLRDNFFHYRFERGFVMSSKNFQGCKANFPVGFLIWNLANNIPLEVQQIALDVFNSDAEKIGIKPVSAANRADFLNKWIKRPPAVKKFPPLSGGFNVAAQNKDRRDRIAENFLASFMCNGNDFMHQNRATFLSGPYVSAGALSVTPENFERCMVVHMVRRLPVATWLNDRDQFMQPTAELSRGFIADAVVWSLFAPSNQTVSLRGVEYEGELYDMPNNLYPWLLAEVKTWACGDLAIQALINRAAGDRFAALWLAEHSAEISSEGAAVLAEAKRIYKVFYEHLNIWDDLKQWKIEDWDIGWYQVRMAFNRSDKNKYKDTSTHFYSAYEKLSAKLLKQIYALGFLRDEVKYFGEERP